MRKILAVAVVFLLSASLVVNGQPVLKSSVVPALGTTSVYLKSGTFKTFNAGASGANVTWNFSSLDTSGGYYTDNAAKADTTFFYSNFPTIVNYATEFRDIFGDRDYVYAKLDTAFFESYGTANEIYTNPVRLFNFPFTYNNQFTDVFYSVDSTYYGVSQVKADGYGTLQLPTGIFTNVLRVKTFDAYRKITLRGFDGTPEDSTNYEATHYRWYSPAFSGPLLEYSSLVSFYFVGGNRVNVDTFGHVYSTNRRIVNGLTEAQPMAVNHFPNPVTDVMTINADEALRSVSVYDITGKLCYEANIEGKSAIVSFQPFVAGMYQCKVVSANNHVSYFKICHNQ